MKLKSAIISVLFSTTIFAHGMNKPGPHGGYIKMPSSYHVELLNSGSNLKIYLLDINFKNPTTKNSSVTVEFSGVISYKNLCEKIEDHFECPKPKNSLEGYNKIIIYSEREAIKASSAQYALPLKFE